MRSVVDHTPAHLAVTHRAEHEGVGAGEVNHLALDLERAAARGGGGDATVAHGAVVAQCPAPPLAGHVGVDLALDLEAAVVGLDLELPAGPAAAAPGVYHQAAAT